MRSRSSANAPAMLFQLAGSPVQRRGPRYTSAPHEATIITLPPLPFASPLWCHLFPIRASISALAVLMFCIKQIVNALPSLPVKAISQKTCRGLWPSSSLAESYSALASTSAVNLTAIDPFLPEYLKSKFSEIETTLFIS